MLFAAIASANFFFFTVCPTKHTTHGLQRGSVLSFNPLIFTTVNWHQLPYSFVNIWKNFCRFKLPVIQIKLKLVIKFYKIKFCVNYHNDTAVRFNRVKQKQYLSLLKATSIIFCAQGHLTVSQQSTILKIWHLTQKRFLKIV